MRVSTSELLVVFIVALLVLGPEKVPKYAKKAGKLLSSVKVYADKLTDDINESIVEPLEEVQKPLKDAVKPLTKISDDINKPLKDIEKSVNDIGKAKKKEEVSSASIEEVSKSESAAEESSKETEIIANEVSQES